MKNLFLALILSAFISFTSCSDYSTNSPGNDRELSKTEKQVTGSADKFGLKLFKEINKSEQEKNIFISPLSVSIALGMTLNGARNDTYDAMRSTLELNGLNQEEINSAYKTLSEYLLQADPRVIFKIANSIWYRDGFYVKPDFIRTNTDYFNSTVSRLNFSDPGSVNIINNWVKENTNNLIDKIINEIPSEMVMYLINAIYFKGDWVYKFDKQAISDEPFSLLNGDTTICKLMNQKNEFDYYEDEIMQAVKLPYGNSTFNMVVILPKNDINSFISRLSLEQWETINRNFAVNKGNLWLLKFKMEYELTMNDVLKLLGMKIAFDPYQADFKNISDDQLYISEVKHKTFVDVNEEGTEAAAVTSVGVALTSAGGSGFYMKVNKPFIFAITENSTNSILFIGKNINPEEK